MKCWTLWPYKKVPSERFFKRGTWGWCFSISITHWRSGITAQLAMRRQRTSVTQLDGDAAFEHMNWVIGADRTAIMSYYIAYSLCLLPLIWHLRADSPMFEKSGKKRQRALYESLNLVISRLCTPREKSRFRRKYAFQALFIQLDHKGPETILLSMF